MRTISSSVDAARGHRLEEAVDEVGEGVRVVTGAREVVADVGGLAAPVARRELVEERSRCSSSCSPSAASRARGSGSGGRRSAPCRAARDLAEVDVVAVAEADDLLLEIGQAVEHRLEALVGHELLDRRLGRRDEEPVLEFDLSRPRRWKCS